MDLKQGLSLVAFGFLFALAGPNLTPIGRTFRAIPDWIGSPGGDPQHAGRITPRKG